MANRRRLSMLGTAFGAPIALAAVAAVEQSEGPVWVQVCEEGTYLGHPAAKRLEWDRAFFETLVANFHQHPWYTSGADGVGSKRVVPFDFNHASEMAPTEGTLPQKGAPAFGWALELAVRDGADGKAQLWALSEFRDDILAEIKTGGYATTSIAVDPDATHPVTGEKVGPVLSSIALTNTPFVQGMDQIAATLEQWGTAETAEEALVGLRRIFELPENADIAVVQNQIRTLRELISAGQVPESVDQKYLLEQIRRLVGIGLLSTTEQILGGAEAALQGAVPQNGGQSADQNSGEPNMAGMLTALAAILCCAETEQGVIAAARETKASADKAADASEAIDSLGKLKELFGSADMQDLIAKATKTVADAEALKPTLEALAAAHEALKSGATTDAEDEAQAVAASLARGDKSLQDRLKPAILAARVACIKDDGGLDEAKLAKFREDYPLEEEQRALLSRRVVAGPNGQQLGGAVTGYRTEPVTASTGSDGGSATSTPAASGSPLVDEINAQPGRNPIEKTNALLCAKRPAHKALPFAEQCRIAGEFCQQVMAGQTPTI